MIQLYRLSEYQQYTAGLVGVDDIERRQHVHQLTHKVLAGCRQASQPFSWLRACGLRSIAEALSVGLEDGQALAAVLEASYSQVLEVILSTLDRDLIPPTPPLPQLPPLSTAAAADSSGGGSSSSSSSSQLSKELQQCLLAAVGRYPAGHAPTAASSEELLGAYKAMQVLVLLHSKSRALLSSAQYLQLVTARACEAPTCLPHALHTLLALLQGNEEAQAMFVTTGGLDMLLTRTLQHTQALAAVEAAQQQQQQCPTASRVAEEAEEHGDSRLGSAAAPCELLLQLLVFLQLLLGWGTGEAVRRGAHPSTQRAALSLMSRHLGTEAAKALTHGLSQIAATTGPAGVVAAETAAAYGGAGLSSSDAAGDGGMVAMEELLRQRAVQIAALITPA